MITICSNQKIQGGGDFIPEAPSILKALPGRAEELVKRRNEALRLIHSGFIGRDGIKLNEMQFNSRLVRGPEFGGEKTKAARYMPAADRYAGRFYTAVKAKNSKILKETPHHILIISALYGVVLPEEMIQVYSCHIEDHPSLRSIWTKDDFLTSITLSYIRQFKIDTVFDLTSQDTYRELVNWNRISSRANVLHVFGEQYAGPALLATLGELARDHILGKTEQEIKCMQPGQRIFLDRDKVIFTKEAFPPAGYPREQKREEESKLAEAKTPQEPSRIVIAPQDVMILDYPRDIKISSKGHNTIFEKVITNINDLPAEIRDVIREFSRCPDVLEVFFEKRAKRGRSFSSFRLKLLAPREGSGFIFAKIEGRGEVCHSQDVSIRVTKNREQQVYHILQNLLAEKGGGTAHD